MPTAYPNLLEVDWSKIPAPVNDGAASHLPGMKVPDVALTATDGSPASSELLLFTSRYSVQLKTPCSFPSLIPLEFKSLNTLPLKSSATVNRPFWQSLSDELLMDAALASVMVMPNSMLDSCTISRMSHCRPLMLKRPPCTAAELTGSVS